MGASERLNEIAPGIVGRLLQIASRPHGNVSHRLCRELCTGRVGGRDVGLSDFLHSSPAEVLGPADCG